MLEHRLLRELLLLILITFGKTHFNQRLAQKHFNNFQLFNFNSHTLKYQTKSKNFKVALNFNQFKPFQALYPTQSTTNTNCYGLVAFLLGQVNTYTVSRKTKTSKIVFFKDRRLYTLQYM